MEQFTRQIDAEQSRDALMAEALQTVTIPLARHGYVIEAQTNTTLTYVLTYRPWWIWVLTIGLFPIGLLAYFSFADHAYITITFESVGEGSRMRISGEGTGEVAGAFATMSL